MAGYHGDEQIKATANHILQSMGSSDQASEMLRILASFDDRFAAFATPAVIGEDPDQKNVDEGNLEAARQTILGWDLNTDDQNARQTVYIWTDRHPEEARAYLDAVDRIQSLVDCHPSSVLDDIQAIAMLRLEEEFRNLMESHGGSMDPEILFDAHEEQQLQQDDPIDGAGIDLLPPGVVADLHDIAVRMVKAGSYQAECKQAFVCIRKAVLEDSLDRLGLEKLSIEEVHRMPWELLEKEISKWIRILKLAVRVLFPSEKQLCKRVLAGICPSLASTGTTCFLGIAKASLVQALNFGEAVAVGRRAPEKVFKLLDMYEALRDLLPAIDALFEDAGCSSFSVTTSHASSVLARLGDAGRGTFLEFENAVRRETSRNPVPGGAVHPLTRYVMNYMRFSSDYTETLNQLLQLSQLEAGGGASLHHYANATRPCPLSAATLNIMGILEKSLDTKSKLYREPALTSLFLINNLRYIDQKAKDSGVRKLVGDEWIKRNGGKIYQHHHDYRRTAWTKVLACLKDAEGGGSGSSRNAWKERFKSFNAALEENVKAQSGWIVPDPQLCTELRISITDMILPAYRSFLGRFQNQLDSVKHSDRYVKYTPEDVEAYLNQLFGGSSWSMNSRT